MLTRRRARGERGAVLVESAFVLPVLLFLTLAVIEFGFFFSTKSTTVNSTRDGARFATAYYAVKADKVDVGNDIKTIVERDLKAYTGMATPTQMWIYRADSAGLPVGGDACNTDCMLYTWNGASEQFDYVNNPGSLWTSAEVDACVTSASPGLDEVGVMVEAEHRLITPVLPGSTRTLRERTVLRLEPLPTQQC